MKLKGKLWVCRDTRPHTNRWTRKTTQKYVIGFSPKAFDRHVMGFGRFVLARIEPAFFERHFGFVLEPGEMRRIDLEVVNELHV